jgi:hypothetical protein
MTGRSETISREHLVTVANEAVRFPETVTIEQIRELGEFAQAVLSRDSAPVDGSARSAEAER